MLLLNHFYKQLSKDIRLPTYVILPGMLGSIRNWQGIAKHIHHNVLILDLPGHGNSYFKFKVMPIEEMAYLVLELLEHYSLKNVILVGHSLGGKVAMACSMYRLFEQLVLVDIVPKKYPPHHFGYYPSDAAITFRECIFSYSSRTKIRVVHSRYVYSAVYTY